MNQVLTDTDSDVTDVRWSPEAVRVHEWRYEMLKRAGFTEGAAGLLAQRTDVDWHTAIELIKVCPEQKALNILL